MAGTDFAILIPARFQSSRFPGKPLAALRGAGGEARTLIERSWRCAMDVPGARGVWVATDDERIADEVRRFGGEVVMTSSECRNGTERCAEAVAALGDVADIIVNLQGDAPLSPTHAIRPLVERLVDDEAAVMATPAVRCNASTYDHLATDAEAGRVGGTTVVFNRRGHALYFSKRILPYLADGRALGDAVPVHLHLGIYAYRRAALERYRAAEPSWLEDVEGLEQLRFLDLGERVAVVETAHPGWDVIELNNPSDVPAIERILRERNIA